MTQEGSGHQQSEYRCMPGVLSCYGYAWDILRSKLLEFFLIVVIAIVLALPSAGLSLRDEIPWFLSFQLLGFSLLYLVFFYQPLEYGVKYAFLKGARGEAVQVSDIFEVFRNYLNAVLAHILVSIIIGFGILFCIVPGIIFACKLVFVPYLVVDRKMDVMTAIRESWRLTTGHGMTVFLIGLTSIPIYIAGLLACFVGIIFSAMWVEMTFASLYWAVTRPTDAGSAPSSATPEVNIGPDVSI